jgi:hypothetical protein
MKICLSLGDVIVYYCFRGVTSQGYGWYGGRKWNSWQPWRWSFGTFTCGHQLFSGCHLGTEFFLGAATPSCCYQHRTTHTPNTCKQQYSHGTGTGVLDPGPLPSMFSHELLINDVIVGNRLLNHVRTLLKLLQTSGILGTFIFVPTLDVSSKWIMHIAS